MVRVIVMASTQNMGYGLGAFSSQALQLARAPGTLLHSRNGRGMLISVHALATVMRTFIVNVFTNEVHAACGIVQRQQPFDEWQPKCRSGAVPCCQAELALLGAVRGVMHCGQCFGRSLCRPPPTWRPGQGLGRAPELLLECRDDVLVALRDACERRCPAASAAGTACCVCAPVTQARALPSGWS